MIDIHFQIWKLVAMTDSSDFLISSGDFKLLLQENRDRVNQILKYIDWIKKQFWNVYEEFRKIPWNQEKLQDYASYLLKIRPNEKIIWYEIIVFAIFLSRNIKSITSVFNEILDLDVSFFQFISEFIDWDYLEQEFQNISELGDFLSDKVSLHAFKGNKEQVAEIIFLHLKNKFLFPRA